MIPKSNSSKEASTKIVDVAGIGTSRRGAGYLPYQGRSRIHVKVSEKSQRRLPAEVIVVGGTSRDCEYHIPEISQNSEGPNIELRPNSGQNVVLRRDSFPLSGQGPNKYDRKSTTTARRPPKNLYRAYRKVVSNKGASGVDGMKADQLRSYLDYHRVSTVTSILNRKYVPQAIRGVAAAQ